MNKKLLYLLLTAIVLLIMILLIIFNFQKNDNDYLKEISYQEFNQKMENKETFVLLVKKDNCSYCEAFEPKMKEVASQYKVTVYELNTSKLNTEDNKSFFAQINISGTPTTVFIDEGTEKTTLNRIVGNGTKDKIISKFKDNGYIK